MPPHAMPPQRYRMTAHSRLLRCGLAAAAIPGGCIAGAHPGWDVHPDPRWQGPAQDVKRGHLLRLMGTCSQQQWLPARPPGGQQDGRRCCVVIHASHAAGCSAASHCRFCGSGLRFCRPCLLRWHVALPPHKCIACLTCVRCCPPGHWCLIRGLIAAS
jgi:hypothetical protein